MIHRLITTWNKTNLMKRIAIGIVLGVILALLFPKATGIGLLGEFFVGGLRHHRRGPGPLRRGGDHGPGRAHRRAGE